MRTRDIAIIGCGAIGAILSRSIDSGGAGNTKLISLFDSDPEDARALAEELNDRPKVVENINGILNDDEIDLVVEAASQRAVKEYAEGVLLSGKDLVTLSVGAFSDEKLLEEVREIAKDNGRRVYLPSGAILGLDGIQAAEIAGFEEVVLTTRKPPETLASTKYVEEEEMDISDLEKPMVIFSGTATDAVKAFPESVNVAASLSIAGEGFEKTKVKVVADPSLSQNVHEIEIKGEAGEFRTEAKNFPSPENPKTSYLAALSAIRTLRNLTESVLIGV